MNLHAPRMPVATLGAVLLLLSAGSGYTDVHSSGAAMQPTQIQKYLKVTQPGIFIPLRDIKRTYLTGARLPLFQETFDDYIVKVETVEEGPRLCAFPKRNREGIGTAWVTDEKWLIFGRATTSCPGRFYLFRGEILPIVDETPNAYYVRITRYKRSIILPLPKNMEGLVLFHRKARPTPSLSTAATTSGTSRVAAAPAPAAKKQPRPQAVRIVHHRIIEASPPGAGDTASPELCDCHEPGAVQREPCEEGGSRSRSCDGCWWSADVLRSERPGPAVRSAGAGGAVAERTPPGHIGRPPCRR